MACDVLEKFNEILLSSLSKISAREAGLEHRTPAKRKTLDKQTRKNWSSESQFCFDGTSQFCIYAHFWRVFCIPKLLSDTLTVRNFRPTWSCWWTELMPKEWLNRAFKETEQLWWVKEMEKQNKCSIVHYIYIYIVHREQNYTNFNP